MPVQLKQSFISYASAVESGNLVLRRPLKKVSFPCLTRESICANPYVCCKEIDYRVKPDNDNFRNFSATLFCGGSFFEMPEVSFGQFQQSDSREESNAKIFIKIFSNFCSANTIGVYHVFYHSILSWSWSFLYKVHHGNKSQLGGI